MLAEIAVDISVSYHGEEDIGRATLVIWLILPCFNGKVVTSVGNLVESSVVTSVGNAVEFPGISVVTSARSSGECSVSSLGTTSEISSSYHYDALAATAQL